MSMSSAEPNFKVKYTLWQVGIGSSYAVLCPAISPMSKGKRIASGGKLSLMFSLWSNQSTPLNFNI